MPRLSEMQPRAGSPVKKAAAVSNGARDEMLMPSFWGCDRDDGLRQAYEKERPLPDSRPYWSSRIHRLNPLIRSHDKLGKVSLILLAVSSLQTEGLMDERVNEGGARVPYAERRAACLRSHPN